MQTNEIRNKFSRKKNHFQTTHAKIERKEQISRSVTFNPCNATTNNK